MATSVKMDERTKDRLERLVDTAYEFRSDFIDSFREEWDGLTDEEIERFLSGTVASGNPVDEEEIDEVLYGPEIE